MTPADCDDVALLAYLRRELALAKRKRERYCLIPLWMLRRVVEQASRPHD